MTVAGAVRRRTAATLAVALVAVLTGSAGWLFTVQRADAARAQGWSDVADVARESAVAILSYRAESVEEDTARARGLLAGDFHEFYARYTADVVVPEARARGLSSAVDVVGASVVSVSDDAAVALVFANQTTSSADAPAPATASVAIRIELAHADGSWSVTAFDPV